MPRADEAARLRQCLDDLGRVVALATRTMEPEPRLVVSALLDGLVEMVGAVFVLARFVDPASGLPDEMLRVAHAVEATGEGDLSFVSARMGLRGELGIIVVAAREPDFPRMTDKLVLDVAAAQAALAFAQTRLKAASANEHRFRLLVETIPALVWRGTADGDLDYLNRRAVEYLGHTAESLSGGRWLEVIHPDHRETTVQRWMQSVNTGTSYEDTYQLRRADGEYRWTRSLGEPLRDSNGQIVEWYGLILDVDGWRHAEEELRRSEAFLAQAQRLTLTGSIWWKVATDELVWSQETFRVVDVPRTTTPSIQLVLSRVHPEDLVRVRTMLERSARDGTNMDFEHRLVMPDGAVKFVRVVLQNVGRQAGKPEFVGAVTDITARRQAEEALNKTDSELAHVARVSTLSTLTASITHEINQPLSGIITNASTCLRMLNADPPDLKGARETARRGIRDGNRAADVIARLRALFSKREFTPEPVDLNVAAREVIAMSMADLRRNRINVVSELADDLPPITGDRVQLQQVILNLLRNASDAMANVRDRPKELSIVTARDTGDRVRMTVRDTGQGFNPDTLEQLFVAFYSTKRDGMGIGLSVSRTIVERHHGRLWAELNAGPGAAFSFSIPVNAP